MVPKGLNMRLQKYLSQSGVASRRASEEMIKQGRISVNGKVITEMGYIVLENDTVAVDGNIVSKSERKVYILLNKPVGYVSTAKDQFGRPTVIDLVKGIEQRLYPVGRLDYDTSGLIILTNDGDFTYSLTHPKHEIDKIYEATINGHPSEEEIKRFENGLVIEDYTTSKAKFKVKSRLDNKTIVEITIHEGKNRQVRKMCEAIGHKVLSLKRIAIGEVKLRDLEEGKWRELTVEELELLSKI